MINNFDLQSFSMPLEFSPQVNFQVVYAITAITAHEKHTEL
jgi:hypothetical protein